MPSPVHRVALGVSLAVFYPPVKLFFRFRSIRRAALPRRGAAIVCANHVSLLDPIALQAAWWRPVRYLMDAEFYYWWPIRGLVRLYEAIPVEEGASSVTLLRRAGQVLERGDVIGIFPEGGVSRDGRLRAFRSGAAVLALRHGAPVVPAWIDGTRKVLPRDARFLRAGRITVTLGEPLVSGAPFGGTLDEDGIVEWTRRVRGAVAALAPSPDHVAPEPLGVS